MCGNVKYITLLKQAFNYYVVYDYIEHKLIENYINLPCNNDRDWNKGINMQTKLNTRYFKNY